VALVSLGERPRLMRISTLFGGEFKGAVRATELSVTTNMAANKILQDSMAVSSPSGKIEKQDKEQLKNSVDSVSFGLQIKSVNCTYMIFQTSGFFMCQSIT